MSKLELKPLILLWFSDQNRQLLVVLYLWHLKNFVDSATVSSVTSWQRKKVLVCKTRIN